MNICSVAVGGLKCDVGLEDGEYQENCLCITVLCTNNGAQRYEQFLQVGRLYRALMLFGLALSSEHLCVFGLHINFFFAYTLFFLLVS